VLEGIHFVLSDIRKKKLRESAEVLTKVLPSNVQRLFDGNATIEVTSEEGEFDFYLKKECGVSIPMRFLSGGEKKRIGLSIVFAFAKMGSRISNVLIADEIYKDLDPGGREAVYELLSDLNMDTVLITSHDQDISKKSNYNQIWEMVMENGRSKLII
jgi:DNA repair exonuclease SbcCD ATPase subunit